ncbi:MAG: hypothetical protein QM747_16250 [Nocardioides sp.]
MIAQHVVRRLLTVVALLGLAVPSALAGSAQASHGGDDVRTSGSCGSGTHWKLKAKHDDGRIEVEAEIDSNTSGQKWHWTLKHNGSVSSHGSKRTSGRSGSFEVGRRMSDLSGLDHFVLRATHGGTVCRGKVSA